MFRSNIPQTPFIEGDAGKFFVGDYVRVLLQNKNEYIGRIEKITFDKIEVDILHRYETLPFALENIQKIRYAKEKEDFYNTPYFDEEELEFWKTHIISRGQIVERTEEEKEERE